MRHRLLHYLETRAINLGFGQSPMSRRLLMLLIVLRRISLYHILVPYLILVIWDFHIDCNAYKTLSCHIFAENSQHSKNLRRVSSYYTVLHHISERYSSVFTHLLHLLYDNTIPQRSCFFYSPQPTKMLPAFWAESVNIVLTFYGYSRKIILLLTVLMTK